MLSASSPHRRKCELPDSAWLDLLIEEDEEEKEDEEKEKTAASLTAVAIIVAGMT